MPTYEYECVECGNVQSILAGVDSKPSSISCELCRGKASPIISPPAGFRFPKGSPDTDRRNDEYLAWVQRTMAEPIEPGEIETAKGMLREREKRLGKPEGSLTGERPTKTVEVDATFNEDRVNAAIQEMETTKDPVQKAILTNEISRLERESPPTKTKKKIKVPKERGEKALAKDAKRAQKSRGIA